MRRTVCLVVCGGLMVLGSCTTVSPGHEHAVETTGKSPAHGYLSQHEIPDSLVELPPPPSPGSAALAMDEDIARRSLMLKGGARWNLAISDADLDFPRAARIYSCALGLTITSDKTPTIWKILQRSERDLSKVTRRAKKHYQRARPFLLDGQPVCTPEFLDHLRKSGSYPSSHSSIGWGWALILAELAPDRTDAIMVRARAYGESRNVCNVHWHSDVMQGRLLASAVIARLHADAEFRSDMDVARTEMRKALNQADTRPDAAACQAEAAALAEKPSLAQ